jgi:hypothetical protein
VQEGHSKGEQVDTPKSRDVHTVEQELDYSGRVHVDVPDSINVYTSDEEVGAQWWECTWMYHWQRV